MLPWILDFHSEPQISQKGRICHGVSEEYLEQMSGQNNYRTIQ